MGDMSSIHL
jgi:hypothetical protein